MKKDNIPFNDWSKQRIEWGVKKCTSRRKRYPNDKRVTWISPKLPWWFIRRYLYKDEGAENMLQLQNIINGIYNRKILDDEMFYVHFGNFKEVIGRSPIK